MGVSAYENQVIIEQASKIDSHLSGNDTNTTHEESWGGLKQFLARKSPKNVSVEFYTRGGKRVTH